MRVIFIISLFIISASPLCAQLLRPTYKATCPDYPTMYENRKLTFDFNDNTQKELLIKINNPKSLKIDSVYFTKPSSLLRIQAFNDSTVVFKPLTPKTEQTERNNLIVIGKLSQGCSDTLINISVHYTAKLFRHLRFLSRVELGYLNNMVTFSGKSSLTGERYMEESNPGLILGGELVEWRASPENYNFGLSIGFNSYFSSMTSITNDTSKTQISTKELLFNLRGDLPLQIIHKSLKNLSLRIYYHIPLLLPSFGSLSPGINDKIIFKPFIGFGLNYNLSKWCSLELKNTLEYCESDNTNIQANTKINYNMLKSEFIFSFINVYDNISELISE